MRWCRTSRTARWTSWSPRPDRWRTAEVSGLGFPVWSRWLLSGLFTLSLLTCLMRLRVANRRGSVATDSCAADGRYGIAAHLLMATGMLLMFAPAGDPVPQSFWIAVFALFAAGFAIGAARSGPLVDQLAAKRRSIRLQQVMACVGMAFMAAVMPTNPYVASLADHDHSGSAPVSPTSDVTPASDVTQHLHPAGFAGTMSTWLASGFALYFLVRTCWLARAAIVPARQVATAGASSGIITSPRFTASYELLMNLGMGVMMLSLVG